MHTHKHNCLIIYHNYLRVIHLYEKHEFPLNNKRQKVLNSYYIMLKSVKFEKPC